MDKARRGLHPVAERHVGSEGQGQSLAVLEGTAAPYSYKTMAEAGPIRGLKAKELSAERTTELMQVMKAFTRDWGIVFDVEVTVAPGNTYALVARFSPRNFFVHDGRRLSSVMTNAIFGARAKALYQAVAADLKARCVEAFAIKDPAVHFCVKQTIGGSMGPRPPR